MQNQSVFKTMNKMLNQSQIAWVLTKLWVFQVYKGLSGQGPSRENADMVDPKFYKFSSFKGVKLEMFSKIWLGLNPTNLNAASNWNENIVSKSSSTRSFSWFSNSLV